jgi:hypothetical protein
MATLAILWPLWLFYGHFGYFMAPLAILWLFGKFCGYLVNFVAIW